MKTLSSALLVTVVVLLSATSQAQTLPDYLPTDGLVGWWPFNGNANDESGNGNQGVVQGAMLTEDRFGSADNAYVLDGTSDKIRFNLNSINNLFPSGSESTTSIWVKTADLNGPLISMQGNNSNYDFHVGTLANVVQSPGNYGVFVRTECCGTGNNIFGEAVSDNAWHMLTIVRFSNGSLQLYFDGLPDVISASGQTNNLTFDPEFMVFGANETWIVGAASGGCGSCNSPDQRYLNGVLDDIVIYNRALTPEEIATLYAGQPTITDCLDPEACNFEAVAEECVYPEPNLDCAGNCLNDADGDGVCDAFEITGCTDPSACNYNPESTEEDGSCVLPPELDLPESIAVCEGESVVLDAGAGYDSYLWSTGETTQTIEVNEAGNYAVEVGTAYAPLTTGSLPAYLPEDGLVGWWPFYGDANDESGNGNNGEVNGVTLTADRFGDANSAYAFDGNDDFIGVSTLNAFQYNPVSYSFWYVLDTLCTNTAYNTFCAKLAIGRDVSGNTLQGSIGLINNTEPDYNFNNFAYYTGCCAGLTEFTPSLHEWHQLVMTYDANETLNWYHDGELISSESFASGSNANIPFNIGSGGNRHFWDGVLDDLGVWSRALTPEEVVQLYASQAVAACTSSASVEVIVQISGCTDATACNYSPSAACDDASCSYPTEPYLDCDGNCLNDANGNGICDELDVSGCTFEGACNYNAQATVNDNSCFFATAVFDCDGNCQQDANNNGICDQLEALGAQLCGEGTVWDNALGACIGFDPCPADLTNDGVVDTNDILQMVAMYGTQCD